ncbi:MAG: cobalamin-dependent protein [Methanoregulaceae archaeon]|nr:cobalamin-dependent protein [Methanoregulaceae archaeon]
MNQAQPRDPVVPALLEFKGEKIRTYCEGRLAEGADPYVILDELVRGLDLIGEGYEDKECRRYFNSDLIVSGRNMRRAIGIIRPHLPAVAASRGTVLIGTVQGDVHDIGKTIVAVTLESHGFRVIDLGTDVPAGRFCEGVRVHHPDILCLSALLTSTAPAMDTVIRALTEEGLRNTVFVMVGGRAVTRDLAAGTGADAYAKDSVEALRLCEGRIRSAR